MRILITNPTTWPYVRRGVERFINELARYLASQGIQATILAAKPGATERHQSDGYETVCYRRLWHPMLGKVGWLEFHSFFPVALAGLLREEYDVVQSCTFMDAFAAIQARRLTGKKVAFFVNGMPPKERYYQSLSLGGAIFSRSLKQVDELQTISQYMHDEFESKYGRGGTVLAPPVDTDRFVVARDRDFDRPMIVCTAALDDARKGGSLLMRGFDLLKKELPGAVLRISCRLTPELERTFLSLVSVRWRGDVEFLGAGQVEDLPKLYGQAAISVLPSVWEAFGLVVLESLATGTPVVVTRSGALPELVDDSVGRVVATGPIENAQATDAEALARGMKEAIELSRLAETALTCRSRAERYSWRVLGPRYVSMYRRMAGCGEDDRLRDEGGTECESR